MPAITCLLLVEGRLLAFADKLDNLTATFYRGEAPTGSTDPYALAPPGSLGDPPVSSLDRNIHFALTGANKDTLGRQPNTNQR